VPSASKIEWTEATWNPVTGCTKVSAGCLNCYAERMAHRLQAMGNANYRNGFDVTLHPHLVDAPLKWRTPRLVFVNSMSDLFHEDIPAQFIRSVFATMEQAHWHTFQVLTKRSERLAELAAKLPWPQNVWMGVSVENDEVLGRIDDLQSVGAAVRFLSLEPLLGPLPDLDLKEIDWAIVGGESGPGARAMLKDWVIDIQAQCKTANVAFFFKQWGGVFKKRNGRKLQGRTWDELPQPRVPIAAPSR
jgi:protein gp37